MRSVKTISEMRHVIAGQRAKGRSISFVPTMGALHEGHLTLVDEAKNVGDTVVMSIFVNPLQFGPSEDFDKYPRTLEDDAKLASKRGVDYLFTPTKEDIYPEQAPVVLVHPGSIGKEWEGAVRPHHFEGVLTVVAKLFHIVMPDVAVFGQKDLQQAAVVKAMVRDLNFPVGILVAPTVREPDGLAMSSRNRYLSPKERDLALILSRALFAMRDAFARGERRAHAGASPRIDAAISGSGKRRHVPAGELGAPRRCGGRRRPCRRDQTDRQHYLLKWPGPSRPDCPNGHR